MSSSNGVFPLVIHSLSRANTFVGKSPNYTFTRLIKNSANRKTRGVKNLFLYTIMVLLMYPAIQSPAEILLHLKCLLHKLQGLELLLTRCRRTPCFTVICPQQLTTSFMHDGKDYGCGRYWYWYQYWNPILTLLLE